MNGLGASSFYAFHRMDTGFSDASSNVQNNTYEYMDNAELSDEKFN